jgi:predicted transcriptional regulator
MKKSEILNALATLPEDDVTIDDVVERLLLVQQIKESIRNADEGNVVTHEEAKKLVKGLCQR